VWLRLILLSLIHWWHVMVSIVLKIREICTANQWFFMGLLCLSKWRALKLSTSTHKWLLRTSCMWRLQGVIWILLRVTHHFELVVGKRLTFYSVSILNDKLWLDLLCVHHILAASWSTHSISTSHHCFSFSLIGCLHLVSHWKLTSSWVIWDLSNVDGEHATWCCILSLITLPRIHKFIFQCLRFCTSWDRLRISCHWDFKLLDFLVIFCVKLSVSKIRQLFIFCHILLFEVSFLRRWSFISWQLLLDLVGVVQQKLCSRFHWCETALLNLKNTFRRNILLLLTWFTHQNKVLNVCDSFVWLMMVSKILVIVLDSPIHW